MQAFLHPFVNTVWGGSAGGIMFKVFKNYGKEESFKSEALKCLNDFSAKLDEMKASAKGKTLILITDLQIYSTNLQSFLKIKNPNLDEISNLGGGKQILYQKK